MRLQVMHERSRICRFACAKLVTFELILKKLSFMLYPMRPGLRNNEFTYHGLISYSIATSPNYSEGRWSGFKLSLILGRCGLVPIL